MVLFAETPVVLISSKSIVKRFDLLVCFAFADTILVCHPEKGGRDFGQPLRFDDGDLVHVLLRGENQLVVDTPLGWPLE